MGKGVDGLLTVQGNNEGKKQQYIYHPDLICSLTQQDLWLSE